MSRLRPSTHAGPPKTGKRTAAEKRRIKKWREDFCAMIGQCELCNRNYSLHCHEISRGTTRQASLTEPCCILVLCNAPHGIKPSCHSVVGAWPREKQLALLLLRRGSDYDLKKYWSVIDREKPEQCDVDGWVQVLIRQDQLPDRRRP